MPISPLEGQCPNPDSCHSLFNCEIQSGQVTWGERVQTMEDSTVFIMNGNVCNQTPQLWCSQLKTYQRTRLKNFLTKSTFFTFGIWIVILVASIALSSQFQPLEIYMYTNSSYCYASTSPEVHNATPIIITPSSTVHSYDDPQWITVNESNIAYSSAFLSSSSLVMYSSIPIVYSPTPVVLFPTPIMHSPVPDGWKKFTMSYRDGPSCCQEPTQRRFLTHNPSLGCM